MACSNEKLNLLSEKLGIQLFYNDPDTGKKHFASKKAKQAICRALGYPADTDLQLQKSILRLEEQDFLNCVPFSLVLKKQENTFIKFPLVVPKEKENSIISWVLTREDGTTQTGSFLFEKDENTVEYTLNNEVFQKKNVSFNLDVDFGYHSLSILIDGEKPKSNNQINLIVAPTVCYLPEILEKKKPIWGIPIQVYALKSHQNWGIGDFTDLGKFSLVAKKLGAHLVGINPLNALFLDSPKEASPYSASSRIFLNPLYIDIEVIEEAKESIPYQEYKKSDRFLEVLNFTKKSQLVEYSFIAEIKLKALELVYETFKKIHLNESYEPLTQKGQSFIDFCNQYGETLDNFALFQVLRQKAMLDGESLLWWRWPKAYQDLKSIELKNIQKKYNESLWFIKYQQFIAFQQYNLVGKKYLDAHLSVGLYGDLPVSVNANSSEVWANQKMFLSGLTIGAPPDVFNKKGQDWALGALNPFELKKTGFSLYKQVLQSAMQNAGAIRIDHAFSLMRLFLQVGHNKGAYLTYPFEELTGILALESYRNKCLVIAEDLGVPPFDFHEKMLPLKTFSFRLMRYQKNGISFKDPKDYEIDALITPGTHDMPTYTAFWKGLDIELYRTLKLISTRQYHTSCRLRILERMEFFKAFRKNNFIVYPLTKEELNGREIPNWFIPSVYQFLAKSSSLLLLARLEDMLFQDEQINVPGTYLEYPNWRYKLRTNIEKLAQKQAVKEICEQINKERS